MKGEEKVSKNPLVITLKGETYDKDVKEWLDIAHPFYSLKNFSQCHGGWWDYGYQLLLLSMVSKLVR